MKRLVLLSMLILSACHSGWDKDPFVAEASGVQNAVAQGTDQKGVPPLQGIVFLDVEPYYNIYEGESRTIQATTNITHPEFKLVRMEIKNYDEEMFEFKLDQQKQEITFVGDKYHVPDGVLIQKVPFTVSVITEYKGLIQETRRESAINIMRGGQEAPIVESVVNLPRDIKEGSTTVAFKVFVRDRVSPKGPTLNMVADTNTKKNGSQYIDFNKIGVPVAGDPTLFEFTAYLNLKYVNDMTAMSDNYSFVISAYSVFGIVSSPSRQSFTVYTKAEMPRIYVDSNLDFKMGENSKIQFMALDPSQEGLVAAQFVENCADVLAGAICGCAPFSDSVSRCTMEWNPRVAGSFSLTVKAINTTNPNYELFKDQKENTQTLNIRVIE